MADSPLASIFGVLNKLQETFASAASSSRPLDVPKLKKLNDMVYEVHSPPPNVKPDLEVVFFHGLQLRPSEDAHVTTWMSRDNSQLWLKTWLVELFPKARIFTISYDSSIQMTHQRGRLDMYRTAENLVHSLTGDETRVGQAGCPVVLVGHCLGGLVLKEVCLSAAWMLGRKGADRFGMQRVDRLIANLRGMFFLGTPHLGSLFGDKVQHYFKGALLAEIETLKASSARRNEDFYDLQRKRGWVTSGIGESSATYVEFLGEYIHLVPEASTRSYMDSYYSAAGDHYEICKPEGKNATPFRRLKAFLSEIQTDEVLRAGTLADAKSRREYVIDLKGRASKVCRMLAQPDTHTIFITGLSGIGKTTLAQQVFHDISHNFSVTCFVSLDALEAPSNPGQEVVKRIQNALGAISGGSNPSISRVVGYLKGRKVLMVLDNVESEEQLRALHLETWLEGSASQLIVTSTNALLGTSDNTFVVPYLSDEESQQLFSHFAFGDQDEPEDVRLVVQRVIEECERFPLPLKVVGGYMSKENIQDKQLWLDVLDRLEKAQDLDGGHDHRLMAKLRWCYDSLQPPDQEIFLDIATLFHGFPISKVECVWRGCRESPHLAMANLQRRFLAHVDLGGKIWMHKILRNVGYSISCPSKSGVDKWKRISRSSFANELITKHQGDVDAQAVKLEVTKNEILTLRNSTFANYANLEYLMLEGLRMSSGTVELPPSLVYLRWKNGLFTSCPVDFGRLTKLVVLELVDCKSMKCLPPSVVNASKLLWLELEGCLLLTELPLGLSRDLEYLSFNRTSVQTLPSDLWKFKGLKQLHAKETQLTRVPGGIGRLEMLSSLDLSGTRVVTLPESLGGLRGLRNLDLSETMVTSLPDSIGRLHQLETLRVGRTMLSSLPESIGRLQSLRRLDLQFTWLKSLPQSLGDMAQLEELWLGNTPVEILPDSVCKLHNLTDLELQETQLSTLPNAFGDLVALEFLSLDGTKLTAWSETPCSLPCLENMWLDLGGLRENSTLSLESGHVEGQTGENTLALRDQESQLGIRSILSQLSVLHAVAVVSLSGYGYPQHWLSPLFLAMQHLPELEILLLSDFNLVEIVPSELGLLTRLKELHVDDWERLRELPESLGELPILDSLGLSSLPALCKLPESLGELPKLCKVELDDLPELTRLPESWASPWLSRIGIYKCGRLQKMLGSCNHMSTLDRDASTSQGRQCKHLDSLESDPTHRRQLDLLESDSWEALELVLGCQGQYSSKAIRYYINCHEMQKVWKKAVENKGGDRVIDIKVAVELINDMGLRSQGGNNDLKRLQGVCSHHSSSHNQYCPLRQHFAFRCEIRERDIRPRLETRNCDVHGENKVRVMDLQEESGEVDEVDSVMDLHEESIEDSGIDKSEASVMKYLMRPLVFLVFSLVVVSRLRRV